MYHTGAQHDISEASSGTVLIASSWMSVLVIDPIQCRPPLHQPNRRPFL